MERLDEVLRNEGGSYILPFFWMHGEAHDVLREEMARVAECGIREVCLESRPHPDYCGPQWWSDVDLIMDEARRRGMRVWVLDDSHFPTGYANGAYKERPELAKLYLAERHTDLMGPAQDAAVLVAPFLPEDAKLLAVLACPRPNLDTDAVCPEGAMDVTSTLQDGFVRVNLPAGAWRLYVLFTTRTGGGRPHYMNLLDPDSVKVLLDAVYEPHYARYKDDFGGTFAGFFSDEPELGNSQGYDFQELPGKPGIRLPWSDLLESRLRDAWGADFAKCLPALWYGMGAETPRLRYQYMDAVSRLVEHCFSAQLGAWCAARGVEYIGHIIEDDNAHGRLGCSIGHYFREMRGQHMAGIDVVHHQIIPGFTGKVHHWVGWETDGEFFHFGLAKLGSSAARHDPNKAGRAMCEIFGNFGWAEGIGLMKWLTDHMLVRGINHFVPHAFSPKDFPDRDCPPHFYARGHNPQFRFFAGLMRYMNRMAHLMSGGAPHADAAVLYHADSAWGGGEAMLFQKPVRALMEDQLCCDVLPADLLADGTAAICDGRLMVNGNGYASLVIPYCEYLPAGVAPFVLQAAQAGLQVLFVDGRPVRDTLRGPLPRGFDGCGRVVGLDALAAAVRGAGQPEIAVAERLPNLRFMSVRQGDDRVMMFFNEAVSEVAETQVRVLNGDCAAITWYDGTTNCSETYAIKENSFILKLAPGETAVAVLHRVSPADSTGAPDLVETVCIDAGWEVSACATEHYPAFEHRLGLAPGAPLPNMNAAGEHQDFVGVYRYEAAFEARAGGKVRLHLPMISDAAAVTLNGADAGMVLGNSGRLEVTGLLRDGANRIAIEIANTLVWQVKDPVSVFVQVPPTGLLQAPVLEYYR